MTSKREADQAPEWDRPEVLAVIDRDRDWWRPTGVNNVWRCYDQPDYRRLSSSEIERNYGPVTPLTRETRTITQADHAAILARVADAAKAEGYREGYGQACEDAHATAALSAIHPQPEPEATPEPVEPADGELNAFSADFGFFCHYCGPKPDVWQPGSVTR